MTQRTTIHRTLLAAALALAATATHAQGPGFGILQAGSKSQPTIVYDGLILTFRDGTRERTDARVAAAKVQQMTAGGAMAQQWRTQFRAAAPRVTVVRRLAVGADLLRPGGRLTEAELDTLMRTLRADPAVAHVQPNYMRQAIRDRPTRPKAPDVTAVTPDDPGFVQQWHLRTPDGHLERIGTDTESYANAGGIDAPAAWQFGEGAGVVVAVIDTGLTRHPDIDQSVPGYDFITDALVSGRAVDGRVPGGWDTGDWTNEDKYLVENGGCVQPFEQQGSSWHGSHVSGTVAMLTNNGLGMSAVAPEAKVLPIRALGHCGGTDADISDAIVWAAGGSVAGVPANANPAEVINMSLGGAGACEADSAVALAIRQANQRGSTVVVAAGNSNGDAANESPASCPGVINVAATGITGRRAVYSNFGSSITLSAPGGGVYANDGDTGDVQQAGLVWSLGNRGDQGPGEPAYVGLAGTSMASPHVAGVAALVISAAIQAGRPVPTPVQMRDILTQTSRDFPVRPLRQIGVGILDARKAAARGAGSAEGGDEGTASLLAKGVSPAPLVAGLGEGVLYRFDVPAGARNLQIRTFGGSGNARLFVRTGRSPSALGNDATYTSARPGTTQNVQVTLPQGASYFIRVVGVRGGYSNVSLRATYSEQ